MGAWKTRLCSGKQIEEVQLPEFQGLVTIALGQGSLFCTTGVKLNAGIMT